MRKRFEQQLSLGQMPIEETYINPKKRYALDQLLAALKAVYCTPEYNEMIFKALEKYINAGKKNTGRKGMDLWCIFVLAQVRLCLNISYDALHDFANNHRTMRQLMGVERKFGYEIVEFEYQNIYDNVSMLSDELVAELNGIIVNFGHGEVFKKKENTPSRLKTDSFVVESNVHFPTDYNLLWDCARKCLSTVLKFTEKYDDIKGWRKIGNWRRDMKGLMRELGKASSSGGRNKEQKVKAAAEKYLEKARLFSRKIKKEIPGFPVNDEGDLALIIVLEHFAALMEKHIDLVERRILKGEQIPHEEKLFSVFETYTEWIKKGKMHPSVELGKKLAITTDQYGLIVNYQVMEGEQDRDIVVRLADRLLSLYKIDSWSFDKGFWLKTNKELLELEVPQVIMPKLGRRNKEEDTLEHSPCFKRLKNKHSAIESNINELENRGLDRCPERGYHHFKRYIVLGVAAYNLKKIGKYLLDGQREELRKAREKLRQAA
jgi:transposase, IS5 family